MIGGRLTVSGRGSKPFDARVFEREVKRGMDALTHRTTLDFARTYQSWDHKPAWREDRAQGGLATGIRSETYTEDENYRRVNNGTFPRPIVARRANVLVFRHSKGFTPKTRPGVIGSGAGSNTGPWVRKKTVWHKGIKPRFFDRTISRGKSGDLDEIARIALAKARR